MLPTLDEALEKLKRSIKFLPQPQVNPPLVVVSGLPGAGKSFFCRKLAERLPCLILASDTLRRILFPLPQYSEAENRRLFSACHVLVEELLRNGIPIIFDATNLVERHREFLYRAADRAGARLILVWVQAPTEVVKQRLLARERAAAPEYDSEAGWEVYQRMKTRRQRIYRNHLVVDTSRDISPVIDKIVRAAQK